MPGHRFPKGHPQYGGRKPGQLNKKTLEIQAFSRQLFAEVFRDPQFVERLKLQILSGKESHLTLELLRYAYGKPPDRVQLTGEDGGPLALEFANADLLIDKFAGRIARLAAARRDAAGAAPLQPA